MTTPATSEAHTDEGLSRFSTVVTFVARVGALNAGLMGVFNWNLLDALLPHDAGSETSLLSQGLCLGLGLLGVVTLVVLAGMPTRRFVGSVHATSARLPELDGLNALHSAVRVQSIPSVTATGSWALSPRVQANHATGEHALIAH
ncbi:MAG: hypothetical protein RL701_2032 [Pseudomonadota bacterium]